jgi:hypothetical protein
MSGDNDALYGHLCVCWAIFAAAPLGTKFLMYATQLLRTFDNHA